MEVKKKMNVIFKDEEEYQKFKNGKTHSKKGLRTEDGKLSSLPDIEEIKEDEECYYASEPLTSASQLEMGVGRQIMYAILKGLYEGVREVLSDEQNRQAIALLAKNWWDGKAVPKIKKGWHDVKGFVTDIKIGETKASKLLKEKKSTEVIEADCVEVIAAEKVQDNRQRVTPAEYQQQVDQIRMLAMLLADRIKKLSNSCVDSDKMTDEEYRIQQNEIKELTADEVMNSVKLLVVHESFSLDEPTIKMFSEFISGNLIVEGELIPIETVRDSRARI